MRRVVLLVGLMVLSGCGDDDPATSRLVRGDKVRAVVAGPTDQTVTMFIGGHNPWDSRESSVLVSLEPGTMMEVMADTEDDPESRVPGRLVVVVPTEGSYRGREGRAYRRELRPASR